MSDTNTQNSSESGDNSTTAQFRDNHGILNLGGNNTFNGKTIVNGRVVADDGTEG